jgi:hypothetical protein
MDFELQILKSLKDALLELSAKEYLKQLKENRRKYFNIKK